MTFMPRAASLFALGVVAACGLSPAGTSPDEELDGGPFDGLDAAADSSIFPDGSPSDASLPDGAIVPLDGGADGGDGASTDGPLVVDTGADVGANVDAAVVADTGLDSGFDSGFDSGLEAGLDSGPAADACIPQASEDCTNGRDDNCNGLVDCSDPDCGPQYECVPTVPTGWNAAALNVTSRATCPTGFGTPRDVVVNPSPLPAGCTCTCNAGGAASCEKGSVTFYGPSVFSSDCSTVGTFATNVDDGNCQSSVPWGLFGFGIGANASLRATSVPLVANTCSALVGKTVPPSAETQGKRCLAASALVGGGCPAAQSCARRTTGSFLSCVGKTGVAACPTGWPIGHRTGTGITDTRSCSACTCGSTASCAPATVTFFAGSSCTGTAVSSPADNVCRPMVTTGQSATSWRYDSVVLTEGCQKTVDALPTGTIAVAGEETVCCK